MSIKDDFRNLIRADEIKAAKETDSALQEEISEYRNAVLADIKLKEYPIRKMKYLTNVTKAVITECATRLYMKSLIIDKPEQYAETLMPIARKEIVSALSEATTIPEVYQMLDHASPYIKAMFPLCEEVCAKKADELDKDENAADKPFEKSVVLDKEDLSLIHEWEKNNSKDVYAGELQDRVVKVYEEEEKASKEQKDKVQAIVDSLSEIEEPIAEAVTGGINTMDNNPKSLFNAIFMNKSRAIINEAGEGGDISAYAENILCETICTYTLLECIHSLGLHTYTGEEKIRLIYDFAAN